MSNASFEFKAQTGDVLWLKAVPEPPIRPEHGCKMLAEDA